MASLCTLWRLAAPSGLREVPTPLVLSSGLVHSAASWARSGLPAAAGRAGWSVDGLDLPGYGKSSRGWPVGAPLDVLVEAMRAVLAPLPAPPAVVAPSIAGPLFQKYLETWPLAALVLVSPLPPAPASLAARMVGSSRVSGSELASALRITAADEMAAAAAWLAPGEDGEALFSELEPLAVPATDDAVALCGFDAAGAWLSRLACDEPVRLEPSPVPMLAIFGAADNLLAADDREATLRLHELTLAPDGSIDSPAGALAREAAVVGEAGAICIAGGHDPLHGRPEDAEALASLLLDWLNARF